MRREEIKRKLGEVIKKKVKIWERLLEPEVSAEISKPEVDGEVLDETPCVREATPEP
jgi:hypothetical protein